MSAIERLRDEHVLILRALTLLERATHRLQAGEVVGEQWWAELVAWLRGFADRNHHAKEERALFPAMARAGVPTEGGPIGVMLEEHTQGRTLLGAMADASGAGRVPPARGYVELLRAHIDKENAFVFPLGEAVLDEFTQAALAREFTDLNDRLGREASLEYAAAVLDGFAAALESAERSAPAPR
jgi:hemerythrin-like domain-containing protein